jgi:hypothetical protein
VAPRLWCPVDGERRRQSEKRAAIEAAVLEATEALLSEGASSPSSTSSGSPSARHLADGLLLLLPRQARAARAAHRRRQRGAAGDRAAWWSGDADIREALAGIAELYREHGALMRAAVEVSTYDEEVAVFWRSLVGRFVEATRQRIEAEQAAGRALAIPAHATAMALTWMVERSFYEQLVQNQPVDVDDLVDSLATIFTRSVYGT